MKIRIKGDTIRLRLSQGEVDTIGKFQTVSEKTHFADNVFTYSLSVSADSEHITAKYHNNEIEVFIPKKLASTWTTSDLVGLQSEENQTPSILIEKDFQCLTERGEDESDLFANPNTTC